MNGLCLGRLRDRTVGLVFAVFCAFLALAAFVPAQGAEAVRATLANGLKVVIVPNALAPVVATSVNYMAGSDESPDGFPGTAHALEHMMFRGSPGLSAEQLASLGSVMGGSYNANTRESLTQYLYTVPAADLDVALRIEALRMKDVTASEADWQKERGAIEQEVAADMSSPSYKLHERLRAVMFAGTPYAHTPLGTRESFEKTTAGDLKAFHDRWYAPNNALLVIAGDVEPKATLKLVDRLFGAIPAKTLPARPKMIFAPVTAQTIEVPSSEPYSVVFLALRLPGLESPDYPAIELLSDILSSQRHELYSLVTEGKALAVGFSVQPLPHASIAYAGVAIPAGGDVKEAEARLRAILQKVADQGVSPDLLEAAKRQEARATAELTNSIDGLASVWADALSLYGLNAPEDDLIRMQKVTLEEVNQVAKRVLDLSSAVVAIRVPTDSEHSRVASQSQGGKETIDLGEAKNVPLPDWAQDAAARLTPARATRTPALYTLKNGLRLIVQPEMVGGSVLLSGLIRSRDGMQEPRGKEGVSLLMGGLMNHGTDRHDRLSYLAALDEIGAVVGLGTQFSVQAAPADFDRAVALLAEGELHPAFPQSALDVLKPQYGQYLARHRQTPDYRAGRAIDTALLPPDDPDLRESSPESLASVSRTDLLAFHAKVFRPDMTAIVVIGDIAPEKAKAIVEKYFGAWTAKGRRPNIEPRPAVLNKSVAVQVPDASRVQDSVTLIQNMTLGRNNPDYYALRLGNAVLGGGVFSARLYNDLRVKSGLVYSVGSKLSTNRVRATYGVSYGCDPENAAKAEALVVENIKAMQEKPVTDEELRNAKALMLRQMVLGESDTAAIATGYLRRFDLGLPYDETVKASQALIALSAQDVQAAFKKWLRPDDLVRVVQGPDPK